MKKILSFILIFSILNLSFEGLGLHFNVANANQIGGFTCTTPADDQNDDQSGDGNAEDSNVNQSKCTFNATDSDGENIKDATDVTFQQITLFSVVLNGVLRIGRCIAAAAAGCKCQGWSTAMMAGAMVTVLVGEVMELINYENITEDLKKEFDIKSIKEKSYICDDISNKASDMSKEEYDEFCDYQVKPIKRLISAYEGELSAANAKTWTYGIASIMTTTAMILETVAAATDEAEFLAENSSLVSVGGLCKAEAAAKAATPATKVAALATAKCCAAITKRITTIIAIKGKCEAVKTTAPLSGVFNAKCTIPKNSLIKKWEVERLGACNIDSCKSCQPILSAVDKKLLKDLTLNLNLAIPGGATCDAYTAPFAENKNYFKNSILEKYVSLFATKALAEDNNREFDHYFRLFNAIAASVGGVVGALAFYMGSWTKQDFFHKGPTTRAVFNGINTALLATSSGLTSAVASELEKKVKQLKKLIGTLSTLETGSTFKQSNGRLDFDDDVGRDFEQQFLQNFDEAFGDNASPCAFGESPDGKGQGGCLSQDNAFAQTIDGLNLDGLVGQTTEDIRDFSNEISGANRASEKLLALGKSLNAKRGPLKRILKKAQDDLNDLRGKNGFDPIDFDAEVAKGVQGLKTAIENSLKEQGVTLASLKPVGSGAKKSPSKDAVKKAKKKLAAKKDDKVKATDNGFAFQFDRQEDPNAGITDDSINALREKTDKYKIDKGDISKRSKDDIFKMITTRYFKTALPVLVEEVD